MISEPAGAGIGDVDFHSQFIDREDSLRWRIDQVAETVVFPVVAPLPMPEMAFELSEPFGKQVLADRMKEGDRGQRHGVIGTLFAKGSRIHSWRAVVTATFSP